MAYELGRIRTDRGEFLDKGNLGVDPRHPDFSGGARGDGLHDDAAAFADASTFAAANGIGLVVGPGTFKVSSDITISAAVHLMAGAKILPDTGVTVTFGGAFSASASQHFETGAGDILFSTDSTVEEVNILWWGAVPDSGTTDCYDAIDAAIRSLHDRGGVLLIPHGRGGYFGVSTHLMYSADNGYSNLTIRGEGYGSWIKHTEDWTDGGITKAIFQFTGESAYALTNLRVENLRISGNGVNDLTQIVYFGNVDGVVVDRLFFDENGREGIYFNAPADTKNVWVANCDGRNIGKTYFGGLSAINLNSNNAHCHNNTLYDVGQGIEHTGYGLSITGNNFSKCKVYGMLLMSTWSGWLDGDGVEQNSQRVVVDGNIIDDAATGILFGDAGGRTFSGHDFSGNLGKVVISNNIFRKVGQCLNLGMDGDNGALVIGNYFNDAPNANSACVTLGIGPTVLRGNVFKRGPTSQWAYLVRSDGVSENHVIEDNTVIGQAWSTVAFWFRGTKVTLANNRIVPFGDAISANFLRLGTADGLQQVAAGSDVNITMPVTYSGHQRSEWYGGEPAALTWKVGDTSKNSAPASGGYAERLCTVAGTAGTLNAGATTGSITTGTAALTLSATTGLYPGAMITIAGVTGSFTITALDYTTKIATLDANADATVAAAAVAYKAPTFKTAGLIS